MLYSFAEAAKLLGGISHWTLRKHAAIGRIRVVHIGRRVFLTSEELERIRRDGLPSLGQLRTAESVTPSDNSEELSAHNKTVGNSFSDQIQSGEEQ